MVTLLRFSNLMDAELAKTRLEANGIPVFLAEEASYTAGYGPVTGALRLQVHEGDVARAREILSAEPTITLPDDFVVESEEPLPEPQHPTPLLPLAIGLAVVGILIVFAIGRIQPDRGRNSAAEQTYEQDSNGDGKIDCIYRYENGELVATNQDTNFDGRMDCSWTMRNGIPVSGTADTDFNGVPDAFSTYVHGILQQTDIRPNNGTIVTRRFLWRDGVMRQELIDDDEDGKFDRKIEYDPFSKPIATTDLR